MTEPVMDELVVAEQVRADDGLSLTTTFERDGVTRPVTFRTSAGPIAPGAEALLAAALLPAMWSGRSLRVAGPVSPMLLAGASEVQAVWHSWDARFRRVPVVVDDAAVPEVAGTGVGCFFTAGVDSFHTALACRAEITELVYVHGFDKALDGDEALQRTVTDTIRHAADALGLPLVEVTTDLRSVAGDDVRWPLYHGAALASVALLLAPRFRRMLVPATHTYAYVHPSGSSPLLVPMWSTERLVMANHGAGTTRIDKVAGLIDEEAAMRCLQVCWAERDGHYNCGRCEKCVRTLVELHLVGGGDVCATLPGPLDLGAVARLTPTNRSARHFLEENLAAARAAGAEPELVRALRRAVVVNARVAHARRRVRQRAERFRSGWRRRRSGR